METMAISKFKATCLSVLERVRKTGKPVRVTRFGQPIAEVVPPGPPERPEEWIGSMAGTARIVGDIVGPSSALVEWDTERE
jgi:prevent-host-death family protein